MKTTEEQHIQFCQSGDGISIAYAAVGQGPPLVKAANWLSHLEFDWHSPVWRHWLDGLSQGHRFVRYDQRGCGLSDWEVPEFSLDAWVDDLEAVVEAAGLDRFALLGISQGGPIAIAYAARHPEKVSHLLLHSTYARGRLQRQPDETQQREIEMFNDLIRLGWGKANPAFRQVFSTMFIPGASPEQMNWFNDLQRLSTTPENAIRIRNMTAAVDVADLAAAIQIPTLIFHSQQDALVPFAEGRRLATIIPNARFVPLASQNHILLADEPAWPHFLGEVGRFLGTGTAQSPTGRSETPSSPPTPEAFTLREREILDLLAQGYRNNEIAQALVLSPKTVRNYVSAIFAKLDAHSRGEAIVKAREAGFGQNSAA